MTQSKLQKIFASFKNSPEELIPVLQAVQHQFGYLSEVNMAAIAKFLQVSPSKVYSVATFYTQFRFSPIGRNHIMLCRGTACHVKGAPRILDEVKKLLNLEEGGVTEDREFSLETVACIGACGLAPTMVINDKTYGRLTTQKIAEIIKSHRTTEKE